MFGASCSMGYCVIADPTINPVGGESRAAFSVTVNCTTPGSSIRYTLNGLEPTIFDPVIVSGGTLLINRDWTIKAKAWSSTGEASNTVTADYVFTGDVSSGGAHSLALKAPGTLWAWGLQTNGRLGNNLSAAGNVTTPGASKYSTTLSVGDAALIAAGFDHSVFLKRGGTVWSFGTNATGQLGDNSITNRLMSVQVKKSAGATDWLTGCVDVAAGNGFSAALSTTGEVFAWGNRVSGRLGDGVTTGTRLFASKVYQGTSGSTPLTGISRIAAGGASSLGKELSTKEAGVTKNGWVWAWGANTSGQLGQGNLTDLSRAAKVKLTSGTFVTDAFDVSCGENHTAIVRWNDSDPNMQGRVFCTGQRQYGRLGNLASSTPLATVNTAATVTYPAQVIMVDGQPLTSIKEVAAGAAHTLALDTIGRVWAWGYNVNGALGDNGSTNRGFAALVKNPTNTGDLSNIVAVAAGGTGTGGFSMAVAADGTVYTWGYNANGQLGRGGTNVTLSRLPVAVTGGFDLLPTLPDAGFICSVSPVNYSNSVVLTAIPTPSSSSFSKVEFMLNGGLAAQITTPPWTTTLTGLVNGSHHVYAVATDTAGLTEHTPYADFTVSNDPEAANLDSDGDGVIDSAEVALGTSTTDADTDGDGIPDGVDPQPLVPDVVSLSAASTLMIWSPLE